MSGIWDSITGKTAKRQAKLAIAAQRQQEQMIAAEEKRIADAEAQMAARRRLGGGGGGMLAYIEPGEAAGGTPGDAAGAKPGDAFGDAFGDVIRRLRATGRKKGRGLSGYARSASDATG